MDPSSYAIIIFFGTTNAYLKNDDVQRQFPKDLVSEGMLGFTLVTYPHLYSLGLDPFFVVCAVGEGDFNFIIVELLFLNHHF
jgi:hypothetical protein